MNLEKLTQRAREALQNAQQLALDHGHSQVEALHVLRALLETADGLARRLLLAAGTDLPRVESEAAVAFDALPRLGEPSGQLGVTDDLQAALRGSQREVGLMGDTYVSVEHLLLGLAADKGSAGTILRGAGATREMLLGSMDKARGQQRALDPHAESRYEVLERFSRDLTAQARQGKLDVTDVQGGTFTVNNTGPLGSVVGKALINHPQAAILNTEAIVKRPVVINDAITIRSIMNLCITFDHRILDGMEAGAFVTDVKRRLETIRPDMEV